MVIAQGLRKFPQLQTVPGPASNIPRRDERHKYPYGYPNDEPGEKFKGVHACHECGTKFPLNADDDTECANCTHKKCTDCPRVRPKKVEPELDPDVLEGLRLRWEELKLGES